MIGGDWVTIVCLLICSVCISVLVSDSSLNEAIGKIERRVDMADVAIGDIYQ
jgi:hypothetical protein